LGEELVVHDVEEKTVKFRPVASLAREATVLPDMCPTKEHLDALERKGEQIERARDAFHKELREAHREYMRAADRAAKLKKRFGVEA
jgi:hypothetical protein